jgi:hypothetical protein
MLNHVKPAIFSHFPTWIVSLALLAKVRNCDGTLFLSDAELPVRGGRPLQLRGRRNAMQLVAESGKNVKGYSWDYSDLMGLCCFLMGL